MSTVGAASTVSIDRRTVLLATGVALGAAACAPNASGDPAGGGSTTTVAPASTSLPPTTSSTPRPTPGVLDARLAVDKLTFGPRPGLVAAVEAEGVWAWIDRQLDPVAGGVASADGRLGDCPSLRNRHRVNYDVQRSTGGVERLRAELDYSVILRAVSSDRQLNELMVDFWSNHFNVWRHHTWRMFLASTYAETALRPHALGRFSDLLVAVMHHTAMLEYLDAVLSDASVPGGVNQNLARELLELHTLGIADGHAPYTERDVAGVAQILSGWSLDWRLTDAMFDFLFRPWQHSLAAVEVLGGAFSRPARTYGEGYDDGLRLLSVLATHPSTARHLALKLCRRFVGDRPSDQLVASTADVYLASGTAIAPTLRHIFESDEFARSARAKVRRPFELVVAGLRATDAQLPDSPVSIAAVALRRLLADLGQPLHERRTPDGYPDDERSWSSAEGLLQRWSAMGRLAANRLTDAAAAGAITVDLRALLPAALPATAADLLRTLATSVAGVDLSASTAAALCTALGADPADPAATVADHPDRLAMAVGLVLSHPTFQRR